MAQRLHGCTNDVCMSAIKSSCDAYLNRLVKREKNAGGGSMKPIQPVRCPRERSNSRTRTSNHPATTLMGPTACAPIKCRSISRQQKPTADQNYIDNDLPDNTTAMVQVLVKAKNARTDKGEPWGKILKAHKSNEAVSNFSNFDPLRTLHFLTKELHSKLQSELPNDKNIQQMIIDMEQALNRIPTEVASTIQTKTLDNAKQKDTIPIRRRSRSRVRSFSGSDKSSNPRKNKLEKGSQTCDKINQEETVKLQKQMEESTLKLETSCKQMESLCNRLQSEKIELEQLLNVEKNIVKHLRTELNTARLEKKDVSAAKIKELEQEKNELIEQVTKLTSIIDEQTNPTSMELKSLIQELRLQKTSAEQECMSLRHNLTLANMEKEKYVAILTIRDRQINDIRSEMTQLQEIVNEQLIELQTGVGFVSVPTSQSSVLDPWQALSNKEMGDNILKINATPSSINTNETVHQLFLKEKLPSTSFRELPSGDSSGTSSVLHEMQENHLLPSKKAGFYENLTPTKDQPVLDTNGLLKTIPENQADLEVATSTKALFEELKKQAYSIKLPHLSPGRTNVNFMSSEESLQK